jgi:hypothetical protein
LSLKHDGDLLGRLKSSVAPLKSGQWAFRHHYIYTQLFDEALEDGVDDEEMSWLRDVSSALSVNSYPIHEGKIRERLWEFMADGSVTEEEEASVEELLRVCGIPHNALQSARHALRQFVMARPIQEGQLPTVESFVNLQRDEVCHHLTEGSLLEKKILKTYTVNGQRHKEEGLTVSKSGQIYITSKRILIVGDGTMSIPHTKILDAEIDPDNEVILITKDGRQKPLFLRVPDLIYTGILLESVSAAQAQD